MVTHTFTFVCFLRLTYFCCRFDAIKLCVNSYKEVKVQAVRVTAFPRVMFTNLQWVDIVTWRLKKSILQISFIQNSVVPVSLLDFSFQSIIFRLLIVFLKSKLIWRCHPYRPWSLCVQTFLRNSWLWKINSGAITFPVFSIWYYIWWFMLTCNY